MQKTQITEVTAVKTDNNKKSQKEILYIAYGSNLNLAQMAGRCPTAEVVGKAVLRGWRLAFRGVATIERRIGYTVPVLVWKLQPEDEQSLDRYEGWPNLYYKENLKVTLDGKRRTACTGRPENLSPPGLLSLVWIRQKAGKGVQADDRNHQAADTGSPGYRRGQYAGYPYGAIYRQP